MAVQYNDGWKQRHWPRKDASNNCEQWRIFDFGRVMTNFFDINLLSGRDSGTAEVMFDSIDVQFTKYDVLWENVSGLGVDKTNANIGNRNSLKKIILRKNAEVIIVGSPCHILHNAAGKTSEALLQFQSLIWRTTVLAFSTGLKSLQNANLF